MLVWFVYKNRPQFFAFLHDMDPRPVCHEPLVRRGRLLNPRPLLDGHTRPV